MAQCSLDGDRTVPIQRLFSSVVGAAVEMESLRAAVDRDQANLICLRFLYDIVQRFIDTPTTLSEKGTLIITWVHQPV